MYGARRSTPAAPTSAKPPKSATAKPSSPPPAPAASCTITSNAWCSNSKRGCPVNVDELQRLLSDLAALLVGAGAKKPADALLDFCVRLQPYRERRLKDLVDLLDQAEEIVRTGTPPPRGRGRTKGPK